MDIDAVMNRSLHRPGSKEGFGRWGLFAVCEMIVAGQSRLH